MLVGKLVFVAAVSYLIGSISFAILVSRKILGDDIRKHGSGNAGLTNIFRVAGKKAALYVLLGDVAKGATATLIGGWILGERGKLLAGAFVMLGHIYPLFFGFRGGKGVLTAAAVMLVYDWRVLAVELFIFIVLCALFKYVSLGSVAAGCCLPFTLAFFGADWMGIATGVVIGGGIIYFHRANLVRLKNGTEPKFSCKSKIQK